MGRPVFRAVGMVTGTMALPAAAFWAAWLLMESGPRGYALAALVISGFVTTACVAWAIVRLWKLGHEAGRGKPLHNEQATADRRWNTHPWPIPLVVLPALVLSSQHLPPVYFVALALPLYIFTVLASVFANAYWQARLAANSGGGRMASQSQSG